MLHSLDKYYADLGLKTLDPDQLNRLIAQNVGEPSVQRFTERLRQQLEVGDEAGNVAFYQCFYTELVPGLGMTWSQAYACAYFPPFERVSLPDLEYFCRAHETCTIVLDAGCGDGFALCYLAQGLPFIKFVGVDRCPAALNQASKRVEQFSLTNVELHEGDVFNPPESWRERFDGAILRNIVDDTREPYSQFLDARFRTREKLQAVRPLLKRNARVYVGMTHYPHNSQAFEELVSADLAAAGFHAPPAQHRPYEGDRRSLVQLAWTLTPASYPAFEPTARLNHRPEYVSSYHYPEGEAIPVEDVVLAEECYVNLPNPNRCPRCCAPGARAIYHGGPARTRRNFYKVTACVYACSNPQCQSGYTVAEVID